MIEITDSADHPGGKHIQIKTKENFIVSAWLLPSGKMCSYEDHITIIGNHRACELIEV